MTLVIFILGIIFGIWLGQDRVSELEQTTNELRLSIETAELQFSLLDVLSPEITCNYLSTATDELGKKSDELASEVDRYESSQKITEKEFLNLKQEYTVTLIRDWIAVEKIKEICNGNYSTILYFYSNDNCGRCKDQGIVLTYIKDTFDGDVMIFSLDTGLDMAIVNTLRDSFHVTGYPSVVINNKKYSEFMSADEITDILCKENPTSALCG